MKEKTKTKKILVSLALVLLGMCLVFAGGDETRAAIVERSSDLNIKVVVQGDLGPDVSILNLTNSEVVMDSTVDVSIRVANIERVEFFVGGQLIRSEVLNSGNDFEDFTFAISGLSIGRNDILVVGYDYHGNRFEDSVSVFFNPGHGVPDTGVVKIGGMTVGRVDYAVSIMIVSILVIMCGFFFVTRKQEQRANVVTKSGGDLPKRRMSNSSQMSAPVVKKKTSSTGKKKSVASSAKTKNVRKTNTTASRKKK